MPRMCLQLAVRRRALIRPRGMKAAVETGGSSWLEGEAGSWMYSRRLELLERRLIHDRLDFPTVSQRRLCPLSLPCWRLAGCSELAGIQLCGAEFPYCPSRFPFLYFMHN